MWYFNSISLQFGIGVGSCKTNWFSEDCVHIFMSMTLLWMGNLPHYFHWYPMCLLSKTNANVWVTIACDVCKLGDYFGRCSNQYAIAFFHKQKLHKSDKWKHPHLFWMICQNTTTKLNMGVIQSVPLASCPHEIHFNSIYDSLFCFVLLCFYFCFCFLRWGGGFKKILVLNWFVSQCKINGVGEHIIHSLSHLQLQSNLHYFEFVLVCFVLVLREDNDMNNSKCCIQYMNNLL